MKKLFSKYLICWAVMLAIFNVICFVTPSIAGKSKYTGSFWLGYIFVTISFIGQLACAYIASKAENLKKMFYKLPIVKISYAGLLLTVIFCSAIMAIPFIPCWISAIVCVVIFGFNVIAVTKATAAAEIIEETDNKLTAKTHFVKTLTIDAENIFNRALSTVAISPDAKEECKKVYEAIRYSDPMSNDALKAEENEITGKMAALKDAVDNGDDDKTKATAAEVLQAVKIRNNKCKTLKIN